MMLTRMLAFMGVLALTASCRLRTSRCDEIGQQCEKVCSWHCEGGPGQGCFATCQDHCWDDCRIVVEPPPPAICTPCDSDDDCSGGLCIRPPAGGGAPFCGRACTDTATSTDCPAGFTCSALGASLECLPSSGSCS